MSQQYFIPTSPTSALSTSAKNIKLDLATEDDRKPDHFQEAMKHMFTNSDTSPAPNVVAPIPKHLPLISISRIICTMPRTPLKMSVSCPRQLSRARIYLPLPTPPSKLAHISLTLTLKEPASRKLSPRLRLLASLVIQFISLKANQANPIFPILVVYINPLILIYSSSTSPSGLSIPALQPKAL